MPLETLTQAPFTAFLVFVLFFESRGEFHRIGLSEADGSDRKGDKHS